MINVLKASGEKELFDENKLRESIKRAGIPKGLQGLVEQHVKNKLYNNIPTSEIYKHITEFLETSEMPYSKSKYSLKQAIMTLGPSGYPFEDFVSEILKIQKYETQIRKIIVGKSINHEIDIIAKKNKIKLMIECKFHNRLGTKTDVQVALYTKARFDDVKELNNFSQAWIVTNTKVTKDVVDYTLFYDLKAISWNYPEKNSLRDLIENYYLFPITVLSSLSQSHKEKLLEKHIVLCKDLYEKQINLDLLNFSKEKKQKVLEELEFVLNITQNQKSSKIISQNKKGEHYQFWFGEGS